MGAGDTLTNALIGAAVAVVFFIVPFSPAIGGGVAGYLQQEPVREGVSIGGLVGLFAMVPLALVVLAAASFVAFPPGTPQLPVAAFLVAVIVTVASYSVALAVLGGAAGSIIAAERAARVTAEKGA